MSTYMIHKSVSGSSAKVEKECAKTGRENSKLHSRLWIYTFIKQKEAAKAQ